MADPNNGEARIVRSVQEVQRAHDMLGGLITNAELRLGIVGPDASGKILADMMSNIDVLCWLLGHEHNDIFQENLDGIEKALRDFPFLGAEG